MAMTAPVGPSASGQLCGVVGAQPGQEPGPVRSTGALQDVGEELAPALDTEAAVQGRHVLMDGRMAETEACRDLLLAVAFHQAGERLAKPRRERPGARLGRAHQLPPDQGAELAVKEL